MHKNDPILNFDRQLETILEERKRRELFRSLKDYGNAIDFCSNDYLGFARMPELKAVSSAHRNGATGSRLISGHGRDAETAEAIVAEFHQREAALIFNSGYAANTGLLSVLAGKNDTIITDRHVHASLIDGVILSRAAHLRFIHNDPDDLEKKLLQAKGRTFVVIESIYSMDGDEAPLRTIADLCEQYHALLIVDEAHATGVCGDKGEGLVAKYHLQPKVMACIHTFGKALGLHGAAVTGSHLLKDHLINFARPFIYSTALPPSTYEQIGKAYQLLERADRRALSDNIAYFIQCKQSLPGVLFSESHSPIQGIIMKNNSDTIRLASHLASHDISAKAILSPTVPAGTERIRICIHSYNTPTEIDQLFKSIQNFRS